MKTRTLRLLLMVTWGMTGMFVGLGISLVFLMALGTESRLMQVCAALFLLSGISSVAVRKLAHRYVLSLAQDMPCLECRTGGEPD